MFKNKKKEDAIIRLTQKSVENYEELMIAVYSSSASLQEFESCHHSSKSKVLGQLTEKWNEEMGSAKMSSRLIPGVTDAIDGTYNRLKKHFDQSKLKQETLETAFKHYTTEMDNYMSNPIGTNTANANIVHSSSAETALKLLEDQFLKLEVGGTAASSLKSRINDRFNEYQARIKDVEESKMDAAIGIDLGTTMCCVAVHIDGKIHVIPNRAQGSSKTTPSYVAYHDDGSDSFGSVAKEEAYLYPETTIYDAKRMIGRQWSDQVLQNDRKHWAFEVVNELSHPRIMTWNRKRYPHEISAKLLAQFRLMADEYLDLPPGSVSKAVVTVPAYFTEPQRRATSEAAECAGLKVLNILSEPTAAAIAYSSERRNKGETRKALIYDLGGGTFDVAIALLESENVEILAVDGDTHLGGQDFDQLLMNYCIDEFLNQEGADLRHGRNSHLKQVRDTTSSALARLKAQCERAKERLSTAATTRINVDRIHGDKHLSLTLTKDKFEALIKPLVTKTIQIVDRALAEVKWKGVRTKHDIDDIILVGGSTRIPLVATMLSNHFGGKKLCTHINPDEAVAYGAATQAVILNNSKSVKRVKVQDVTPMTLGVRSVGDKFSRIILKNSKIPCEETSRRKTVDDYQTQIRYIVYQGEDDIASANKKLGEFLLTGIPPKPAGAEDIRLTMKIDANGLLHVHAISMSTKSSNSITISFDRLEMAEEDMTALKKEIAKSASRHLS